MLGNVQAASSWDYDGRKEGVAVYTREVKGSDVPMVKAVTVVSARPEQVWNMISGGYLKVDGLKERRALGTCGEGCEYIYVRLGNWMITDRHYVIRIQNRIEEVNGQKRYVRTWTKALDRKPQGAGAMDVNQISGSWIMEPIEDGTKTQLTYINHIDLGGSVPSSLFSPRFVEKSYDILSNMKRRAPGAG